jgi:hypothetical protein
MGCASVVAEVSPEAEPVRRSTRARARRGLVGRGPCLPRLSCEEEWVARFVNAQVPEVVQPFWAALQRGEFIAGAAARWAGARTRLAEQARRALPLELLQVVRCGSLMTVGHDVRLLRA